jgi:RNA polymerase sigma-70 factor (ECF subfamily)
MATRESNISDEELLKDYFNTGNRESLGALFARYTTLVYGVCLKYLKNKDDSKDAVHQIFEKLITDLKKVQVEYFRGWLHTVTRNYCLMELRKEKPSVEIDHQYIPETAEDRLQEKLAAEASIEQLEEAVLLLNDGQRICIDLFYLQELSYEEVVNRTGYSYKEVKSFIQNGRRNLRMMIIKIQTDKRIAS